MQGSGRADWQLLDAQMLAGHLVLAAGPSRRVGLPCLPALLAGQVASTQVPSRRVRPLPGRLRRLSAAVRRLSQAWFLAVPR